MTAMQMEEYREKIRREWTWLWVFRIAWMVVTFAVGVAYKLFFDISTVLVIFLCNGVASSQLLEDRKLSASQYRTLMTDDAALRARWCEAHDERMLAIRMHAGAPFVEYMSIALNIAALIAAPFSQTVTITLLVVAEVQLLVSAVVRVCWTRKLTSLEAKEEDA